MEAAKLSTFIHSPTLKPRPGFGPRFSRRDRVRTLAAKRDRYGRDYSGRLVNESLVVLRKRVQEMKMMERNYEPPAAWMDWEKQCYAEYDESICRLVGFLQVCLMNTRPSVALAMLAITAVSVPFSTVVILSRVVEATDGALSTVCFY